MSNVAMMMGLSSGAGGVDVADVFSTDLYTGNGSTQDIVNGLDLSTEGGMVWFARRNGAEEKNIFNTYAPNKYHRTTTTAAQETITTGITSYNTDGFSLANWNNVNGSGDTMVSWSWVKTSKFFDVIEYTGDGVLGRTVNHSLDSEVGMILVKQTSAAGEPWYVYHRSLGTNKRIYLNTTGAAATSSDGFWTVAPTSTEFSVAYNGTNKENATYTAYVFAHNEDLVQCGSYTGNGSSTGPEIDLGFEPQWLLIKKATGGAQSWAMYDTMRGITSGGDDAVLFADTTSDELTSYASLSVTSTGFKLDATHDWVNTSGETYIYMAIKAED